MTDKPIEKISWLASYPKSGNTWLRALLTAYRNNGVIDINQLSMSGMSDAHVQYLRIVSPIDIEHLGTTGKQSLRFAMLLHQLVVFPLRPLLMKTHNANAVPARGAPLIPWELTTRAIYLVRDPRDVFTSVTKYLDKTSEEMIDSFNDDTFCIGSDETVPSQLCGWSSHVKSWTEEEAFPVLLVRYEDLLNDAESELTKIVEFLGIDLDERRVIASVEACRLDKLRKQEEAEGFKENLTAHKVKFFDKGGSRWNQELAPQYLARIERDHGEMMEAMGYSLGGCLNGHD